MLVKNRTLRISEFIALFSLMATMYAFPDKGSFTYVGRIIFLLFGMMFILQQKRYVYKGTEKTAFLWIVLFSIVCFLNVIFSSNQTASVNTFIIVLQSLVISFILVIWCDSEDKLQAAFKILAICSLIFCIRVVLHIDLARFGTRKIGYIMGLNANTIGLRCALCFLICLFLVTTSKGLFNKTFYSLVLIVNFAIIMATGSRRALIIIILCSFIDLYKKT